MGRCIKKGLCGAVGMIGRVPAPKAFGAGYDHSVPPGQGPASPFGTTAVGSHPRFRFHIIFEREDERLQSYQALRMGGISSLTGNS
jgi:hypothetical protein